MEEWRVINNDNNYSVSNLGSVRNDKTGRILKPSANGNGYLQVHLFKNGIQKTFKIHRLVGIHFLPNWRDCKEIDHKNHDILDNRVFNLRWATISENNANVTKRQNTSSKFVGVYFHKSNNKWKAHICCQNLNGGKQKYLGLFKTEEEANSARCNFIIENNLEEFYSTKI